MGYLNEVDNEAREEEEETYGENYHCSDGHNYTAQIFWRFEDAIVCVISNCSWSKSNLGKLESEYVCVCEVVLAR